jgi:hypothetical protein
LTSSSSIDIYISAFVIAKASVSLKIIRLRHSTSRDNHLARLQKELPWFVAASALTLGSRGSSATAPSATSGTTTPFSVVATCGETARVLTVRNTTLRVVTTTVVAATASGASHSDPDKSINCPYSL